jgi:hypothetical protein
MIPEGLALAKQREDRRSRMEDGRRAPSSILYSPGIAVA